MRQLGLSGRGRGGRQSARRRHCGEAVGERRAPGAGRGSEPPVLRAARGGGGRWLCTGAGRPRQLQGPAPRGSSRAPPPPRPAWAGKLRPGGDNPANGRARALGRRALRGRGPWRAAPRDRELRSKCSLHAGAGREHSWARGGAGSGLRSRRARRDPGMAAERRGANILAVRGFGRPTPAGSAVPTPLPGFGTPSGAHGAQKTPNTPAVSPGAASLCARRSPDPSGPSRVLAPPTHTSTKQGSFALINRL